MNFYVCLMLIMVILNLSSVLKVAAGLGFLQLLMVIGAAILYVPYSMWTAYDMKKYRNETVHYYSERE